MNTNGWSNLHLRYGSPGIDAGIDLSPLLTSDLDGNPRPLDGNNDGIAAFDMGAYESRMLYVSTRSATPVSPYTDWTTAAHTIQDAVDAAEEGQGVLVTNGVYAVGGRNAGRVVVDKAITVLSVGGPKTTVIQGGPGLRALYLGTNACLNGFTLTGESPTSEAALSAIIPPSWKIAFSTATWRRSPAAGALVARSITVS